MQIGFQHTGISGVIKDYLVQKEALQPFYSRFPSQENYFIQAKEKLATYQHRTTLHKVLSVQMESLELSDKQQHHLEKLSKKNTVTVTTGHQLNLMSGPLYFIYKILHTVKICDKLNAAQNEIHFVPIYWMATEDHDFEEINHFNDYHNTYGFQAKNGGFVGDIPSENTENVLQEFISFFGTNSFENRLKEIIQNAYFQKLSLAEATRKLVHELLGEFGILILDANDSELKKCMIPYFEKELLACPTQNLVQKTNENLSSYKNQAYAREINLFYLYKNQRERIEKTANGFVLSESQKTFGTEALLEELYEFPEKFSPNVILRPLYQEVILPNVAYVGGGGELAYWLQLKAVFENYNVLFPMLVLRNSMLLIPNAYKHKAETFDLLSQKMFLPKHIFKNKFTEQQSELFLELDRLEKEIQNKFESLENLSSKTTASFAQMVEVQKQKQLNGYQKMRDRLHKAEQKRCAQEMQKIDNVYAYFFPKNSWQERIINFSEFYTQNGQEMFDKIYDAMPAFASCFNILTLDSREKK